MSKRLKNLMCTLISSLLMLLSLNTLAESKADKIDDLMQTYNRYDQFSGSVLVVENGKVILKKSYGKANREWNIDNQPNTKFRLASITKQFTAMLIMQLVEQGKIKLDARITEYLPDYRKDTGDKVTIHHLLTHTSGIPSYTSKRNFFKDVSRLHFSVKDFVKAHCSDDLEFEPGEKYVYNNSGYFLLGAIIESVTEMTYEAALKEYIFDPLDMDDSGYDRHDKILSNRATGYRARMSGFINAPFLDMSLPYAAGALYSTVEDLYKWDQALYTDKLLSRKNKEIMFTPFLDDYAYGWHSGKTKLEGTDKEVKVLSHAGGINGFSTYILRYVDDKNTIILLNNAAGTSPRNISTAITNILYKQPYKMPQRSIAETLYQLISKKGIAPAIKQYRQMKSSNDSEHNFDEAQLNGLGYTYLGERKFKEAIAVLKLNVEMFPDSANALDSLGEAYMSDGQIELAIKFYKATLEMNDNNPNAVKMLEKLQSAK